MKKEGFSNPEYEPKDFSELYKSDLGRRLRAMRLADRIRTILNAPRGTELEVLEKLIAEKEKLKSENKNYEGRRK